MKSDELIPGARDETNLTQRQPGAIGGDPYGGDIPPSAPDEGQDEMTREEYERDGGGAPRERKHHD